MIPSKWGPPMWKSIHYITFNYPKHPTEYDKQNYKNYLITLQFVLPCETCKIHLRKHLEKYPITDKVLQNRENLSRWSVNIHNEVNKMLGKRIFTYEEARNKYLYGIEINNSYINITIILSMILIFVICGYLYIKLRRNQ